MKSEVGSRRSKVRHFLFSGMVGVMAFTPGLASVAVAADEAELPIKGLRIPLERFEDGRVKMQFTAERARAPEGGEVKATGALVEMFDEAGVVITRIEAETCRFDRAAGVVHSDSAVRMDRSDIEITGVGMDWKTSEQKLRIHSNVRVVLKQSGGLGTLLPSRRPAKPSAPGSADGGRVE